MKDDTPLKERTIDTDVDGNDVHPAVQEMAEELAAKDNYTYEVQINYWKDGRIQLWAVRKGVSSDIHQLIQASDWSVRFTETRNLDGKERGYVELTPRGFNPEQF